MLTMVEVRLCRRKGKQPRDSSRTLRRAGTPHGLASWVQDSRSYGSLQYVDK